MRSQCETWHLSTGSRCMWTRSFGILLTLRRLNDPFFSSAWATTSRISSNIVLWEFFASTIVWLQNIYFSKHVWSRSNHIGCCWSLKPGWDALTISFSIDRSVWQLKAYEQVQTRSRDMQRTNWSVHEVSSKTFQSHWICSGLRSILCGELTVDGVYTRITCFQMTCGFQVHPCTWPTQVYTPEKPLVPNHLNPGNSMRSVRSVTLKAFKGRITSSNA